MKRFVFRLEAVRKAREAIEKVRAAELAETTAAVRVRRLEISRLTALRTGQERRMSRAGGLPAAELQDRADCLAALDRRLVEEAERLRGIEEECRRRLDRLHLASREKKIMENLKERRSGEFKDERRKQDGEFMDFIAGRGGSHAVD